MSHQDNARAARVKKNHMENLRIVRAAVRTGVRGETAKTALRAESAPLRFKRLVREMDIARAAREPRVAAPVGVLSLWKRAAV